MNVKVAQLGDKDKSQILERMAVLYLRLNGYFTTGLILHKAEKNIETELDIIGVRFPIHKQNDTEHNSSAYLDVPKSIDLLIAEVKANGQPLQMNKSLHKNNSIEPWKKILNWAGLFPAEKIEELSVKLQELAKPIANSKLENFKTISNVPTDFGNVSIRLVLFSPERINLNNADKFVNWIEINGFIWSCLCPHEERISCGTTYDFTAWGLGLDELVQVYKTRMDGQKKFESIEELYSDILKLRTNKV